MRLEIERLRLNLSAAERDRALLPFGIDPAMINPNVLMDESYVDRLCKVSNTLALLGQASLEDKLNASIGLGTVDSNVVDFWNVNGIGDHCSGRMCEVRAETTAPAPAPAPSAVSSVGASKSILSCSECKRNVCKVCCAGRGALLLNNSGEVDSSTNRSVTLDSVVCKQCCSDIVLHALILDYVRVLISLRRRDRSDRAACKALDQVVGSSLRDFVPEKSQSSNHQQTVRILHHLLSGLESLAEFPFASFLHSVCT